MSHTLRAAAGVALVVVLSVVWVVDRTINLAQDSNQGIVHTQEVLAALESVLATVVDADSAVRSYLTSTSDREFEPLDRAERTVDPMIDRLAALSADNPTQQTHIPQLRQDAARALAALRRQVQAKRGSRASRTDDAIAQRESVDAVRETMRMMRAEEHRLLADRVQADRIAVGRLQQVSIALVAIGVGLLAWIVRLMVGNVRREREGAEVLRRANKYLEGRLGMGVAELRDSNARLRSIIDSAVDGIMVIDATGRVESFNLAAERLFGYPESEVKGASLNLLVPSPSREEEHDAVWHFANGTQTIIDTGREVTGRRKDGSAFPLHLSFGKMMVSGETKFTGIVHDLSERVRMEKQLREQAALARLGEMAAVIAHEVKNPLAGVRGAVQVIATRLPKDSKDVEMAKEIVSRIDTLNDLVKDMLLFARPPQPKPAPIDVATLVTTTADLLGSDPALKKVQVTLDGTAPYIMADPDLLKIVFVNLLVNGAHAMNGQGTIRVSVGAIADTCQIAFADEGPGIPSDVREKIFMPFFTTKFRGSGLGLPTAKRLVEAHRGSISVACPPAGGTVVTVQLPGGAAGVM